MTEQIIGKVMMTFKGDYDTTKQYNFLDTVEYNGSSFVCKANGTHDTPSENSANWQLLAKAGRDGKDGKDGAPGRDGTEVDLSGYATKEAVEQAQTTADNAYKASSDNTKSISQLSTRVDGIKMPNLSDYAKTSQIPTDVVTHAELTTTKWLDTGTTWLNGNTGSIQYRSITIGNYHIVEVTGSMYITTKAYAITSAFKIPLLGFEDSTTMHFSGGSTIANEIPVAFMAGGLGEVKLYTWQNVNHGWTEVHLSWTYVGGD